MSDINDDPINQIAKKNYELAKSKKAQNNTKITKGKSLIKEPGTTAETTATIDAKGVTANSLSSGEEMTFKVLKTKVNIIYQGDAIGSLEDDNIIKKVQRANKLNARLSAMFIKGDGKKITVLIKSSEPVFKGQKQDIKPYIKKGSIDEPEIEIDSFDDE